MCLSELKIEATSDCAFKVDKAQMLKILDELKRRIEHNKEKFQMMTDYQKSKVEHIFFFKKESDELYKKTGIKI